MNNINSSQNIIILGAGIPGIFSALYLSKLYPDHIINLIESSNEIGGLYNSLNFPQGGVFDKGMHIIYETCIDEIDSTIRNCLPENAWLYLEGNYKDVAGVFWNGYLNNESPYINLKRIESEKLNYLLADLLLTFQEEAPSFKDCLNARDFFERRFGYSITEEIIEPIINKLWRISSEKLDASMTRIVLMDRLCLFSEEVTKDLIKSKIVRSRIGYPNQMNIDLSFKSPQRGLYPKIFGMSNLIAGMEKKLNEKKVIIYKNSRLKNINCKNSKINSINFICNKTEKTIQDIKLLHSTISANNLKNYFNLKNEKYIFDPPLNQKYTFLLLKSPPRMKNLYYFFSFDIGMNIYRVTNYHAYCPGATRNFSYNGVTIKTWPICVELHYKDKEPSEFEIKENTIKELIHYGLINSEEEVVFLKIISAGGFPLLTLKNCENLLKTSEEILNLNISNLLLAGQRPEKGIFFLHDVLKNIFQLINDFKSK